MIAAASATAINIIRPYAKISLSSTGCACLFEDLVRLHQYRLWRAVNPFGQAVQVTALGKHLIDLLKLVSTPRSTVTHKPTHVPTVSRVHTAPDEQFPQPMSLT